MEKSIKADLILNDPAFNKESHTECLLAIDIAWDHLAIAVYDQSRSLWVAFESWPIGKLYLPGHLLEKLIQVKEQSQLLANTYAQTLVLWGGHTYTLVPGALYDIEHSDQYLSFVRTVHAGESIQQDALKNLDAYNIYSIPHILKEGISQLFPKARTQHAISSFAEKLLIRYKSNAGSPTIVVNLSALSFDLVVLKDGHLLFCNSFEYSTAEDVLYYILFAFEQLKITPTESHVLVCGEIMKPSTIDDLMNKYIGRVQFIPRNPNWTYSYVFDELPGHRFYNLLNILPCE